MEGCSDCILLAGGVVARTPLGRRPYFQTAFPDTMRRQRPREMLTMPLCRLGSRIEDGREGIEGVKSRVHASGRESHTAHRPDGLWVKADQSPPLLRLMLCIAAACGDTVAVDMLYSLTSGRLR